MPRITPRLPGARHIIYPILFIGIISLLALPAGSLNFLQPAARAATTFTVNSTGDGADSNTGDGLCNDGAGNCTLRAAIQQANSLAGDDTINVSVTGTINLTGALPDLVTNITINGPGSGLLTVRRDTGGDYRIFFNNNRVINISGLTITNGRTPDGAPSPGSSFGNDGGSGGGILNAGVMTLTDVVVTGNRTGDGGINSGGGRGGWGGSGGGIFSGGTLNMTNVTVSNNATGNGAVGNSGGSGGRGGGIYFGGVTLTMTNVVVSNNTTGNAANGTAGGASGGGGGDGGGVLGVLGTLSLANVVISGNTAGDAGNGGSGGHGGGLMTHPGVATTMTDSTVSNNSSGQGGSGLAGQGGLGGGILNHGPLNMTGCTVSGNATKGPSSSGGSSGGGIFNANVLTMTNCTVSGNRTDLAFGRGGGIYNGGSTMTLRNCTITGNLTTIAGFEPGGGVHTHGVANVGNTIIAGNGPAGSHDVSGNFTSAGNNLIGNGGASTGFTAAGDQVGTAVAPINPQLGPLADNGGPTLTHALLTGSPALDAGNNSLAKDAANNTLTTDQRGVGRFAAALSATPTVDIGAYEFHPSLEDVSDKTTSEDTPLSFPFSVGDGTVAVTSDNQALIPDANLSVSGTGPIRTLQVIPAPNQSGTATITLTATDSNGGVKSDTFLLTVTPVNDAPTFTKGDDQSVGEDSGPQTITNWATDIGAGPGESGQSLTFLVTGNTNPGLFSSAPAVSPSGTLTFTPAPNANGSATVTLALKDDGGTANGGQDTSAAQTFTITVTPANDPPVANDQTVTTSEDTSRFISLTGSDVDGDPLTFSEVTGPSHGTLSGSGSSRTYTPAANFNGDDSFTFKAVDSKGAESAPATVSITVTAVNDAPVNSVPGPQATDLNTPLVFSQANSNAVSVSDVDAGADPARVTLSAARGTLTLGATAGLSFVAGDGADDITMTFTGAVGALNSALSGLTFKPDVGTTGAASLQITTNDQGFNGSGGARSDTDFVQITVRPGVIELTQSAYTAGEGAGSLTVTVRRGGDTSQAAAVDYATDDGSISSVSVPCSSTTGMALDRCDFTKARGRLSFAPGEAEKTFHVLLSDDSYIEGPETALLRLGNPGSGTVLGSRATATLEITDDAEETSANPIDDSGRFVRQHYHDFLNREPDAPGLQFWADQIESCGADAQCREDKRINVSAAFFLSIEFQETGYLVYRLNKAAFGNLAGKPAPVTLAEFLPDTRSIGQGVVVGVTGWEQQLENNKQAFADEFVARARFRSVYPVTTTPEQYVDALNANAGGVLSQSERDSLVSDLTNGVKTRAQVLRAVAENPVLVRRESNPAFVLMQYFGYLRRDPDSAPDTNFDGYSFWLSKLNQFNGNFVQAEMVKAFISSIEYRQRFGQ